MVLLVITSEIDLATAAVVAVVVVVVAAAAAARLQYNIIPFHVAILYSLDICIQEKQNNRKKTMEKKIGPATILTRMYI